jgi:hypothetical protein
VKNLRQEGFPYEKGSSFWRCFFVLKKHALLFKVSTTILLPSCA